MTILDVEHQTVNDCVKFEQYSSFKTTIQRPKQIFNLIIELFL